MDHWLSWELLYVVSPLLVLIGANFFSLEEFSKNIVPSFSKIKVLLCKRIFNLGIIFFIIQVAGVIQYETANIIIARNFGTIGSHFLQYCL